MSTLTLQEFLRILEELPRSDMKYTMTAAGLVERDAAQGTILYRVPLILQEARLQYPSELLSRARSMHHQIILLMQAGQAVLGLLRFENLIKTKVIRRYMVRKSQGKAQYRYLQQRGKSRLGSRIRLQQTDLFFLDINQCLREWCEQVTVNAIYLSCAPTLKGAWFAGKEEPPIEKSDERWRRIPVSIQRPALHELKRIHRYLCQSQVEILSEKTDLNDL